MIVGFTVVYFIAIMVLSFVVGKKYVQNEKDFMIACREFGGFLTLVGNTSILYSGGWLPGVVTFGFLFGFGGAWLYLGWGTGALVALLLWAVFWRQTGALTPSEFFEYRYGRWGRIAAVVIILFASIAIIGWQYVGSGAIIAGALKISVTQGILLMGILVTLYVLMGGIWAATLTDMIQWSWINIVVYITIPIYLFTHYGPLKASALPDGFLNFPFGTMPVVKFVTPSVISFLLSNLFLLQMMVYWTRAASARNKKAVRNGWIATVIVTYTAGIIGAIIGLYVRMLIPDLENPAIAFGAIFDKIPTPLAALALAGVLAATMSTTDIYLVSSVSGMIRDIAQYLFGIVDGKRLLKIGQWATLIYGLLCVFFAAWWASGLAMLIAFGTAVGAPLTIFYLDSWLIKKGTQEGALGAMLTTIGTVLYWNFLTDNFKRIDPLWVAPVLSFIVFYVVSYISKEVKYSKLPKPKLEKIEDMHKLILKSIRRGYADQVEIVDICSNNEMFRNKNIDTARVAKQIDLLIDAGYIERLTERFTSQLTYKLTDKGRKEAEKYLDEDELKLLEKYNLSSIESKILSVVNERGPLNISEMGKILGVSPEEVLPAYNRLVEKGFAQEVGMVRFKIKLNEKGKEYVQTLKELQESVN